MDTLQWHDGPPRENGSSDDITAIECFYIKNWLRISVRYTVYHELSPGVDQWHVVINFPQSELYEEVPDVELGKRLCEKYRKLFWSEIYLIGVHNVKGKSIA